MLFALTTQELMERPDLWEAVHRLRYRIFVEEMGWTDLDRPDQLEIDQFDHDEAEHHLVIRNGELAGYQRMLPTTRPHLLTDVLSDLCEAVWRGDLVAARELHHRLFEINQAVFFDTNPIPIKYMMRRLGIIPANEHRLPMVPATPELEKRLDAVLDRAGLLPPAAA